ncbi:MAG: CopG family transcriptional regulator [Sphingobacteriaceae bacterium]|nr:CopG family transcriptional regulator [Sphingobacteriaceae bacterium]
MQTFTSSLPESLIDRLNERAKALKLPKNKVMERALQAYLNHLDRQEYKATFLRMQQDPAFVADLEMGLDDYLQSLENEAG